MLSVSPYFLTCPLVPNASAERGSAIYGCIMKLPLGFFTYITDDTT